MLADRIVATFPDHGHYVEPFAGSLSVLLAKPPSAMETVNDLDGEVVNFWRVLRDQPRDLARVCALTPHSRVEKDFAQEAGAANDLERARQVWVQLTQGRMGIRRRTGWRYFADPFGSGASMPTYLRGFVDRMLPAAERLLNVSLECRPALDVIRSYANADVLIYADPPYLGSTRTWGNNYTVELRTDSEHRELADALCATKAAVVLSGYPSPLYAELFPAWRRVDLSAFTGQASEGEGARTECLWINRPADDVLDFGGVA
jgi:DNA adenine methylase